MKVGLESRFKLNQTLEKCRYLARTNGVLLLSVISLDLCVSTGGKLGHELYKDHENQVFMDDDGERRRLSLSLAYG